MLLVDDDDSLLTTTAALLEDDFEVVTARSGAEALERLLQHGVDVICTDLQMPEMDGLELLHRAAALRPDVAGVLVTGHRDYLKNPRANAVSCAVLLKPYQVDELVDGVRRAAQHTRLKRSFGRKTGSADEPPSGARRRPGGEP